MIEFRLKTILVLCCPRRAPRDGVSTDPAPRVSAAIVVILLLVGTTITRLALGEPSQNRTRIFFFFRDDSVKLDAVFSCQIKGHE